MISSDAHLDLDRWGALIGDNRENGGIIVFSREQVIRE
jgi:hypothetical protein